MGKVPDEKQVKKYLKHFLLYKRAVKVIVEADPDVKFNWLLLRSYAAHGWVLRSSPETVKILSCDVRRVQEGSFV